MDLNTTTNYSFSDFIKFHSLCPLCLCGKFPIRVNSWQKNIRGKKKAG